MNLSDLSRTVSHALRHEPWVYELELDEQGWTSVEALLISLRPMKAEWADLHANDLERMVEVSAKKRHEIDGNRIRALYGHSIPGRLAMVCAQPPDILYHGTSPMAARIIAREGIKPMGRQYVHLSVDVGTAKEVGRRKDPNPIILTVNTKEAHAQGVCFFQGNDKVWLANHIPVAAIGASESTTHDSATTS